MTILKGRTNVCAQLELSEIPTIKVVCLSLNASLTLIVLRPLNVFEPMESISANLFVILSNVVPMLVRNVVSISCKKKGFKMF